MTNSMSLLKILIGLCIISFFILSLLLWMKTPQLFEYFNQAFCVH